MHETEIRNVDEPIKPDAVTITPSQWPAAVPMDEAGEYADYAPANLEVAAKALGMKSLTRERLKQYHQMGDALQKVGPLKIGRTVLMRCNETIHENIERIDEILELYEGKEGNLEVAKLVESLLNKRANAIYELQKLGVALVKSAGSHLDDEPAKKRAKGFPAGRPVVFAQHATINGQNQPK